MFVFLPDSPITAKGLTHHEKRIAVERVRDNQTGIENKHLKWYPVRDTISDYKTYLFFLLSIVCNVPSGGISSFGLIIIKGFGVLTLVTTLVQIPHGAWIAINILVCVFLNDYMARKGRQTRCWFILLSLAPDIAGAFGLRFLAQDNQAGRLVCYYLTGPYNAALVMILSLTTANTAGHTKKTLTNGILSLGYCVRNIIGPFFHLGSRDPTYELGNWSVIVSHLIEAGVIVAPRALLGYENRKRDGLQSAMEGGLEGMGLDAAAFSEMADRENVNFGYID